MTNPAVTIEVLRCSSDARGYVFQPMRAELMNEFGHAHVVYTVAGAVRGNHYHVRSAEICVVTGPALVRYRDGVQVLEQRVPDAEVWRFTFPAGVAHAMRNEGAQPMLVASFSSEAYDQQQPDVVRDVLID